MADLKSATEKALENESSINWEQPAPPKSPPVETTPVFEEPQTVGEEDLEANYVPEFTIYYQQLQVPKNAPPYFAIVLKDHSQDAETLIKLGVQWLARRFGPMFKADVVLMNPLGLGQLAFQIVPDMKNRRIDVLSVRRVHETSIQLDGETSEPQSTTQLIKDTPIRTTAEVVATAPGDDTNG